MGTKLKHLRNFKINVLAQFRDMWVVVINFFGFDFFLKYFTWLLTVVQFYNYNFGITADYNIL